ncbi:MAG: hypothetical protein OEM43_06325 [Gammaproteobacteria bacterium]|nr:hypothetical protein [Gammaproteobacteria bacterium]
MKKLIPTAQVVIALFIVLASTHILAGKISPSYKYTELQPLNDQQQKEHDDCMLEHMNKAHSDKAYQELEHICYRKVLGYK